MRDAYEEDDPYDDELTEGGRELLRDIEVLIENGPDFGTIDDRKETSTMQIAVPSDAVKRLSAPHLRRLLHRGRLPAAWVEEVREVLNSRGWDLKGYRRVHLDMKQRRMSGTDGGYPAIGYLRVVLLVGMDRGAHMEASA